MQHVVDHHITIHTGNMVCCADAATCACNAAAHTPEAPTQNRHATACAVHSDVMPAIHLAEASMPDGVKHRHHLCQAAKDVSHALNSIGILT